MFGSPLNLFGQRFAPYGQGGDYYPGVIDESGGVPRGVPAGNDVSNERGPASVQVTDPSRYGQRPSVYGGGPMSAAPLPYDDATPSAASGQDGMFAAKRHHKGLFPGKDWKVVAQALVAGLNGYLASQGNAVGINNLQMQRESANDKRDFEYKRQLALQPKMEQVGNTLGMFDPSSLSYNPIYTAPPAPQPFETYAKSLDLVPGTQEYYDAIKEYRAGTWNDEGVAGRQAVQQPRLDQSNTNNVRSTGTSRANNIRTNETSRSNALLRANRPAGHRQGGAKAPTPQTVIGAIMDKQARGEPLSVGEEGTLKDYRTHYKPQHGAVQVTPNETVAHGPNGVKAVLRNGRWVNVATGKPIQ